jgi:ACT domain-containing protein
LKGTRVTGFDGGANPTIEKQRKVALMFQCNEKIIKHKIGLLNPAEELGNVSKACQIMGLSGDTFYRYRDAVDMLNDKALPFHDNTTCRCCAS